MKRRFSVELVVGSRKEADRGIAVKELRREHGFSEASYYVWRIEFGGMDVSDAKRLKALETENARLKKLLAESMLENEVTREALGKKTWILSQRIRYPSRGKVKDRVRASDGESNLLSRLSAVFGSVKIVAVGVIRAGELR